jgi:MFS family permease
VLFSTDLFNEISGNGKEITFYMGLVKIACGMIGSWALGRFGRRPLISLGLLVETICFGGLYWFVQASLNSVLIIPVVAYMVGSALGVGSITLIYTNDLLPPKGVGLCLAV